MGGGDGSARAGIQLHRSVDACPATRGYGTECSTRLELRQRRVLDISFRIATPRDCTAVRANPPKWNRSVQLIVDEGNVFLSVSIDSHDAGRHCVSRPRLAETREDPGTHVSRTRRSCDGARSGRALRAGGFCNSRRAARPVHESGSQSAVRVRHAGIVGPPGDSRCLV